MKLHYKEYGEGPPVVLLHGLLGSSENWHTVARALAETYQVIVPDLRNHGNSPHSGDFDYQLLTADLRELIDALQLHNPFLVGHSMGGKTAMEFALHYQDIPRGIVVEDMAPGQTKGESGGYINTLLGLDLGSATYRRDVEQQLLERVDDRRLALFLLKNLVRNKDATFSWRSNLRALAANGELIWKGIEPGRTWEGPALFVRGGLSDVVADDDFEEILAFFPCANIVTIENASHWLHYEAGEVFVNHLKDFFDSVESG